MKVGAQPQSVLEAVAMLAGAVPRPMFDTLVAAGLVRTLMVATKVGVFEALASGPRTSTELAQACDTHGEATSKLLAALTACGYLRRDGDAFALSPMARKWMLAESPKSLRDHTLLMFVVWQWLEHYETFVRTGEPLDVHETLDAEQWGLYQRGMRSLSALAVDEFVLRTPVPRHARNMIDIGGSHGLFSVVLCRKYPDLHAIVLDLPDATEHAKPLLEREDMGARVVQRVGDARHEDLGVETFDLVLMSNLVHHFDANDNRDLMQRVSKALRPGGAVVVQEPVRPEDARRGGQTGALGGLYFAALSASTTWPFSEIARWQREAGLQPRRPVQYVTVPGLGQQSAIKPRR